MFGGLWLLLAVFGRCFGKKKPFRVEPKAGEDAGAEDAVSGGDHLLVLAAREPAPDEDRKSVV